MSVTRWMPKGRRRTIWPLLAACLAASWTGSALSGPVTLEATHSAGLSNGWVKVERWRDGSAAFRQEAFPPDGRGDQTGQRRTVFGGDGSPHSSRFLLYYAPGWDDGSRETPVLLVHGANQDADLAWADPGEAGAYGCGQAACPRTGLMQTLSSKG